MCSPDTKKKQNYLKKTFTYRRRGDKNCIVGRKKKKTIYESKNYHSYIIIVVFQIHNYYLNIDIIIYKPKFSC